MNRYELYDNENELTQSELEAWVNRFDEAERIMGHTATEALKKLYDYFGKDFLVWLARLYDPETGCFYYSNSARDNEGFLPDCGSTAQALSIYLYSGMLSRYDENYSRAYPKMMFAHCREYLKSLQSPDDGFFYHPQWGKNINSSRRGIDLGQCIEVIRRMGGEPKYPTALERLERATREGNLDSELYEGFPAYMRSEEALLAVLKGLEINSNSYDAGHWISSQSTLLITAGLGDVVCDFLDATQNSETGLWENAVTYSSVSAVLKIGSFYNSVPGRMLKHADKIIESCMDAILSSEIPAHIGFAYNPHGTLATAIGSLRRLNEESRLRGEPEPYDIAALRRMIYSKFPSMVDATIEKLDMFRLPDGSFSYFRGRCAPISQGTPMALRCHEGEVNSTTCATFYLLPLIFSYLGVPRVPIANPADFEIIREILENAEPPKKQPRADVGHAEENFENSCISFRSHIGGASKTEIVYDPLRPNNKALKWTAEIGTHPCYLFDGREYFNPPDAISCFEFEAEFLIPFATTEGDAYMLSLLSPEDEVAYTAVVSVENGMLVLSDTSEYGNYACTNRITNLGRVGEWVRLTLLYYLGEHSAKIKVYRDGMCVKISDNYHGSFCCIAPEPIRYVTRGKFTKICDEKSVIYLDNIKTQLYTDKHLF